MSNDHERDELGFDPDSTPIQRAIRAKRQGPTPSDPALEPDDQQLVDDLLPWLDAVHEAAQQAVLEQESDAEPPAAAHIPVRADDPVALMLGLVPDPTVVVNGRKLAAARKRGVAAEQETLGTLLLSKAAIADVIDVWRVDDFHHPAHRLIYGCIQDLYWRGQPADPVTVSIELDRCGDLFSAGGAAYLHTLISMVPPVGGRENRMSDVLRVSWFERDPGGSTTYIAPSAPSVRLRRHTDGRVAVCTGLSAGSAYPWFVGLPYGRLTDEHVFGPGWSELLVAELPGPDGWLDAVGDKGEDAKTPYWTGVNGSSITAWINGVETEGDGLIEDLDGLRSNALKVLAAVTACERYRAQRETQ